MKAIYTFFAAASLLTVVACSNQDQNATDDTMLLQQPVTASDDHPAVISLDSFQHTSSSVTAHYAPAAALPASRFHIKREKDSVTWSGVFYATHEEADHRISYHTYRFYFKASGLNSYACLRYTAHAPVAGAATDRHFTREAGYYLDFSRLLPHAG